jgi:hypothetical protein
MTYLEEGNDFHWKDLEQTGEQDGKVEHRAGQELGRCQLVGELHHQVDDNVHCHRVAISQPMQLADLW